MAKSGSAFMCINSINFMTGHVNWPLIHDDIRLGIWKLYHNPI